MNRLSQHVRANAIAYLALFVALGGTSYAAINLPTGSVGSRQIKNHAITPIKFDPATIGASVRYWAIVLPAGRVFASSPRRARVTRWNASAARGSLVWEKPLPRNCFPLATVIQGGGDNGAGKAGFVNVAEAGTPARPSVDFATYDSAGRSDAELFDVAMLCPQP